MNISLQELKLRFPAISFRNDLGWRNITSLKIGGGINCLAEPENDIALAELLNYCANNELKSMIIGGGSNIIGQDDEYAGIVIRLNNSNFSTISHGRFHITAGAGTSLSALILYGAEHGFGGLAELSGIPGTMGGAIRMNAGANGKSIGQFVSELCGLHCDGTPWTADKSGIKWGYRSSSIPEDVIITAAILKLPLSDAAEEAKKIHGVLQQRSKTNAKGLTAGCAFKNISSTDPAGRMIEQTGCKKIRCGDAGVSNIHANFIVNHGNATEHDIVELMIKVRCRVIEQTGFYLEPEYRFVNQQTRQQLLNSPAAPKVTVLKGGNSSEREVSLESGHAVADALRKCGYQVTEVDITTPTVTQAMRDAAIVFPVLHGGFGENGELQRRLEQEKIKFIGCGSEASATVFDKITSKQLMDKVGIQTPPWGVITQQSPALPPKLKFPVIVKPPREGSTVGIVLIESAEEWDTAINQAFKFDETELLVEQYIVGTECTIGIVNETPLPMIEIIPPGQMYDYDAKYTHQQGETQYLCPPENISKQQQQAAEKIAMQYYKATGAEGILRVDFIISPDNQYYVLEGNNLPGFTASSLVPKAAIAYGWSFEQLCAKLVHSVYRSTSNLTTKFNKLTIAMILVTLALFAAGIALRCHQLSTKALEYDEIWTLTNYASKPNSIIFSDLGTPNNHPLNSLLIKYSVMTFGASPVALRLFALISGIGVLLASGWLTWEIFKNRFAVVTTVALCSFSGALIHYSQTGRGYMLQTFLLTLLILTIVLYENHRKTLSYLPKIILLTAFPIAAVAAILTLSPSILFITAIALIHWYYLLNQQFQNSSSQNAGKQLLSLLKNNRDLIISYSIIYSFALIWYLSNYAKFKAGQQFGTEINSIAVLLDYLKQFLPKFNGYVLPLVPLLMFIKKSWRKWAVAYLFIILFLICSTLLLRGGPPRTYLPLIPLINIAAAGTMAMIIQLVSNRKIAKKAVIITVSAFIVFCSYNLFSTLNDWQPPDWKKIWQAVQQAFPKSNYFISYPACAGLEISFNNRPQAIMDNCRRVVQPGKFVQIAQPGIISITDSKGSQQSLYVNSAIKPLTKQLAGVNVDIYGIEKITSETKLNRNIVIAYIHPNRPRMAKAAYGHLIYESNITWGVVNSWLSKVALYDKQQQPIRYFILATNDYSLSKEKLLDIEKRSNNVIQFFYIN